MAATVFESPELRDRIHVYVDRDRAGEILAELIRASGTELADPVVLAIPAGGVPVGLALARTLEWPFDIAVVSKITLPWNTEAGYGAIAFDGRVHLNEELIRRLPLTRKMIEEGIASTRQKVERRIRSLRDARPPLTGILPGKTAVLVDDGLASGFTMRAALAAVRDAGAKTAVVAVPTASADSLARIAAEADLVFCPNVRSGYPFAVADAYRHWYDVSEEELERLLAPWREKWLRGRGDPGPALATRTD